MANSIWSTQEELLLVELKEKDIGSDEIGKRLEKINGGVLRTQNSINTHIHTLRKKAKESRVSVEEFVERKIVESGEEDEADNCLVHRLTEYDRNHLGKILGKRSEFVYGLLNEQAQAIRLYDTLSRYEGYSVRDLMELKDKEREEVISLLEQTPAKPKISDIGILSFRDVDYKGISFVLPIQLRVSKEASQRNLASCLNDESMRFFAHDIELSPQENFRSRFRDLIRYNFNMDAGVDLEEAGEVVTERVGKKYPDVKRVYFVNDPLTVLYETIGA